MLEVRCTTDPRRIASMQATVERACRGGGSDAQHARTVAGIAAELAERPGGRRAPVLVVVNVYSDVTSLMVRVGGPVAPLDAARRARLDGCTARWSTIAGRDGRTIVAEVLRPSSRPAATAPARVSSPALATAGAVTG